MPRLVRLTALACLLTAAMLARAEEGAAAGLCYRGINLSGAEYGKRGGVVGTDYIYPSEETIRYFADKGMNAVRLPFRWERLQPRLGEPLSEEELLLLRQAVGLARKAGMTVILDPHNYAKYDERTIGTPDVPVSAFADFWRRVAAEFAADHGIVFGLMNEPYDIDGPAWVAAANEAVAAIRETGATNLVLVPGTIWSGGATWFDEKPWGSNAGVMTGFRDPANHYAFEIHQYLDVDYSGKHATCEKADEVNDRLLRLSDWMRQNGSRAFLGEFGGSKDPACLAGLSRLGRMMADNSDVWIGWTYWAAGEWWPEEEPLNIQPRPGKGTPAQLEALKAALDGPADPDRCLPGH
ncbi:glycoside hydrolase family 5 protein [Gellertiella hungarica]|uniref:Endoglucanase n=1 Tax=Gellertiella hungarica TaxID=1572859 RepID=A0A7W6NJ25_9HYPH|nr:glycoside hydrolase family 5 protein [Gellertiella hungarica]MBB4062965.1 endoglucanase [Gellertiella hungarica]